MKLDGVAASCTAAAAVWDLTACPYFCIFLPRSFLLRLVDGRMRAHRPNASLSSPKKFRTKKFRTNIFDEKILDGKISGARIAWLMIREHIKKGIFFDDDDGSSSMTTMDLLRSRGWIFVDHDDGSSSITTMDR